MIIATDGGNNPKGLTLDEAYAQLTASRKQAPKGEQLDDEAGVDVVDEDLDLEEEEEDFDTEDVDEDTDPDEDDDPDDGEEDSDNEDGEEGEDEIFEIEIDGEVVEVTAEELHKGYLRHNDYTRKRQADAKKAKEFEAEYQDKLTQLNQALAQNVSADEAQLHKLNQQYQQSTDEATKRGIHYKMLQLQQNIQTRKAAMEKSSALQQQTQAAQQEAYWAEQEELLKVQFEDWDTKKVELIEYLQGQGFEDLGMFAHSSMATLVDKAKQFDELQQKRKSVAKKKLKRKVPKTLKAGQGEKKFSQDRALIKSLEARFAKTGSIKDAQALMKAKRGK